MTTIGQVFTVENVIAQIGDLRAGKLGYCLARNAIKAREVTKPAREQCKSEIKEINDFLASKERDIESLSEEHRAELDRIDETEKKLLAMDADIEWYKIKLSDVPGMKDDDPPEKGVLPMAFFTLLLEVGIIDDTEE